MGGFLDILSGIFRKDAPDQAALAAARDRFRARCEEFRLLLRANHAALAVMAEIEEALRGDRPFGMHVVRALVTRVSSSVFAIVRHLNAMTEGGYPALLDRFRAIEAEIRPLVTPRVEETDGPLILPLAEARAADAGRIGGKLANLGELANAAGLAVPPGFAITAAAFRRFMAHQGLKEEIDRRVQAALGSADEAPLDALFQLSGSLRRLIIDAPLPEELETALHEAYLELEGVAGPKVRVAVRSSALCEDMLGASFAGQFHSELNVAGDDLPHTYKEVVASAYTVTAMNYRLARGLREEDVAMAVGCVAMVDAVVSGVAYTRDPLDPAAGVVVLNAVLGLPKAIVDGSVTPDAWAVARTPPHAVVSRTVGAKAVRYDSRPDQGLVRTQVPPEVAALPCLDDDACRELAALALAVEAHYGQPQDIEWAIDAAGRVVFLQTRPLELRADAPPPPEESPGPDDHPPPLAAGGIAASPGAACGPVFVASRDMDALRFPEGAVLVAATARPAWATLLSRAAAVVTEAGSAAGHLANVAREFGVPALMGLPDAVRLLGELPPGAEATVDADARAVYPGRVEQVLSRRPPPRRNLMAGSPVHAALSAAAARIVPLTLRDPAAPEFTPEGCRTLHDITRFCHEMSVREMFELDAGRAGGLPVADAKQLVAGAPMQYWVVDLGGGFASEVRGRFVGIANIASRPMLALWQGMTALSWDGPPPADTKGFLAIVAQAASTPDLDPAAASAFAERNYFLITRDYANLQARFGFHFCTVEAVAGEDAAGNHAAFQFKGGAADLTRRVLRAGLIAALLEELGFDVDIRHDAVFARIEGLAQAAMEERLRALGYLIVHTRQLDMVMRNAPEAARQRDKLRQGLTRLRAAPVQMPAPA